jgi:predicted aspartyl protease
MLFLYSSCTNTKSFYNGGKVHLQDEVSKVDIYWINNLPFCTVEIAGRSYRFLIDTGAPTCISERLFQELQLKPSFRSSMRDSQKKKQQSTFVNIPKIKIGSIEVEDIGAAVFNPNVGNLSCFEMEGIIGANLLAHLYCSFNYSENTLWVSKSFEKLDFNKIDFVWDFHPKHQKPPS